MPNSDNSSLPIRKGAPAQDDFPIVGIGASAGGLEAFTRLLQHLPPDTGMAFILVQHLAPQHPSMLASLLSRATVMQVDEVRDGSAARPNHVYVIPPNTLMSIERGVLQLEPRRDDRGAPRPIDHFFHALAGDRKSLAIGVVLSGTDSDGALGLQAIRAEGGIAIAQSEASAKFPDMPRAAVKAGTVDVVLSPEEIAEALGGIGQHAVRVGQDSSSDRDGNDAEDVHLNKIFALLRTSAAIDFRGYKRGTILRRIARRIVLNRREGLEQYASYLESNRSELLSLGEDLLIHVTAFFRDPDTFAALEKEVAPRLLRDWPGGMPLRIWVPGCSTGEEVYSIAISLLNATLTATSKFPGAVPLQIFGTDLSERAIAVARAGVYSDAQVSALAPDLLARFFTPTENGYQINKPVREVCVFARQNLFVDPPFARLDLVSCRNVLIYLGPALQRQAIATFHYALRPGGYLMLGHSEGLHDLGYLFSVANSEHKFYTRKHDRGPLRPAITGGGLMREQSINVARLPVFASERSLEAEVERTAERIVLSDFGPAWVIVNEGLDIIHSRGDVSPYLQLPPGRASFSLLKMAPDGIRGELRKLLANAKNEDALLDGQTVLLREAGETRTIRVDVRRITFAASFGRCLLIVFRPAPEKGGFESQGLDKGRRSRRQAPSDPSEVEGLRRDLALTTQRLESIIYERDAANQDLTSANEEIQSSNEELHSINEELETSKEELQSTNEELNTVNEELENRNRELKSLTDDLANLLSSTTIPILMLDSELCIRRFTPAAEMLLNVRPGDIGRPVGEIRLQLSIEDLGPIVRNVLRTMVAQEVEVQDREGRWHVLHIRPYRTADNRIEGAVLALIDIDLVRRAELAATAAREFAESVVESLRTPLLVLRSDLRVRIANRAFYESYGLHPDEVENQPLYELRGGHWNVPSLRAAVERVAGDRSSIQDLEVEQEISGAGRRTVCINARPVAAEGGTQILVAVEDITSHKQAERILSMSLETEAMGRTQAEAALHETEAALFRSREELRALAANLLNTQEEERRRVSRELHDDLSQKMAKLQFDVETLEQQLPSNLDDFKRRLLAVRDEVGAVSNDVRRIAYQLHPSTLDHLGLSVALRSFARDFAEREGLKVEFTARKVPAGIPPDVASSLYRVLQEALRNVAKHAGKTHVAVSLAANGNELCLTVRDHGVGFDARGVQGKGGLGLISMQERVRLVRGDFSLKTSPGQGAVVTIRVPLS